MCTFIRNYPVLSFCNLNQANVDKWFCFQTWDIGRFFKDCWIWMTVNTQCLMHSSKYFQIPGASLLILTYKEKFLFRMLKGMGYIWFHHQCLTVGVLWQMEDMYFDVTSVGRCIWAREASQGIWNLCVGKSRCFSVHTVFWERNVKPVSWPIFIVNILRH